MSNKYKQEHIQINLSESFISRSRTKCPYCDFDLVYYWYSENPRMFLSPYNPQQKNAGPYNYVVGIYKRRLIDDYFCKYSPAQFDRMSPFKHRPDFSRFRPKLHRARGVNPSEINESISCVCGRTIWGFNDKSIRNRPELTQRRARYKYPQKFS